MRSNYRAATSGARAVNPETDEEVSDDHIVKGYEISKGPYVAIDATRPLAPPSPVWPPQPTDNGSAPPRSGTRYFRTTT